MFLSRRPAIRPHRTIIVGALAITLAVPAQSQQAAPINWWAEDSSRVAFLKAHGQAYRTSAAVIWAPKDSLDPAWLRQFADSLADAITALKSLIGGPYTWQRIGSRPIQFYFSPGRFVSHADGRDGVFISLARVRQRTAPFLHEAAHELLAPHAPFYPDEHGDSVAVERAEAAFPYWLIEGLPDYLAQATAASAKFPEGDVFAIGGLTKVDSVCAARLEASSRRDEIRDRIGRPGFLQALSTTDRAQVAPVYYACSQSFVKNLVAKIGVTSLVELFPRISTGTWRSALDSAAGKPLEDLRREWLTAVGQSSSEPHNTSAYIFFAGLIAGVTTRLLPRLEKSH